MLLFDFAQRKFATKKRGLIALYTPQTQTHKHVTKKKGDPQKDFSCWQVNKITVDYSKVLCVKYVKFLFFFVLFVFMVCDVT